MEVEPVVEVELVVEVLCVVVVVVMGSVGTVGEVTPGRGNVGKVVVTQPTTGRIEQVRWL